MQENDLCIALKLTLAGRYPFCTGNGAKYLAFDDRGYSDSCGQRYDGMRQKRQGK